MVQRQVWETEQMIRFVLAVLIGLVFCAPAHADTYTVEPFDLDGVLFTQNITQMQFGGTQCPCQKVQYPSTGLPWDNQKGADEIWALVQNGSIKSGDTLMGYSLGVQIISLYMSEHPLPAGVNVLLASDTFNRNRELVAQGQGIPLDTPNKITMVANQYDGWSDYPDITDAQGYWEAMTNAAIGAAEVHNYVHVNLNDPANVVQTLGNITAILIPNQKLPIGDESKRAEIDAAYSRPSPTTEQLSAAATEQADGPEPAQTSEPIAH